jgi:putative hemolysin
MNRERFQLFVILILIVCVIVLGALVSRQNLTMAELSQSVVTLSSSVYDVAVQKKNAIIKTSEKAMMKVANPASTNCVSANGKLQIAEKSGGQYGICVFPDGKQCEEWAMFRSECPVGGVDLTGFAEPADIYCAITGHEATKNAEPGKSGTCKINEIECSAQEYYDTGECKYSVVK